MPTVSHSVTVDAAPETVWAFVSDVERLPEWVAFTDEVRHHDEGTVREGFEYAEYGGVGPLRGESEWEVVACESPTRQVHAGDLGAMQATLTIDIEPTDGEGDGSRWTQTVEFETFSRFRPLGRLLEVLYLRRAMDRQLARTMAAGRVRVDRYARTEAVPSTTA
ncbi:SRPBCC family protein [Salinirubellus salinus]|uniref:SRPBCC family protein n=2 Tax=Salinirubellus salinus TaxID=1364945 RepID=A0A9E7R3J6_9EURY|nr:SRPBCC family protein [Salinirubellus salinus]UWM54793.1 SRPBCC family protein [Salinirubellus salinus]